VAWSKNKTLIYFNDEYFVYRYMKNNLKIYTNKIKVIASVGLFIIFANARNLYHVFLRNFIAMNIFYQELEMAICCKGSP